MITESIVWIIFTVCFSCLFFLKDKFFRDKKYFGIVRDDLKFLKDKSKDIKSMTIDDQKRYVNIKNDLGEDLPTIVIYTILFIIGFYGLLYFKMPNFTTGLIVLTVFAVIFSYVVSKLGFDKFKDYHFINSLLNFLYVGTMLLYIKFFDNVSMIIFIIGSILILWGTGYLWSKVN